MKEYLQLLVIQYSHFEGNIRYLLTEDASVIYSVYHGQHIGADEAEESLFEALATVEEHDSFPVGLIKDMDKLKIVQLYLY